MCAPRKRKGYEERHVCVALMWSRIEKPPKKKNTIRSWVKQFPTAMLYRMLDDPHSCESGESTAQIAILRSPWLGGMNMGAESLPSRGPQEESEVADFFALCCCFASGPEPRLQWLLLPLGWCLTHRTTEQGGGACAVCSLVRPSPPPPPLAAPLPSDQL